MYVYIYIYIYEHTFTSMDALVQHLSPAYAKHLSRSMTNKVLSFYFFFLISLTPKVE